MYKKAPVYNRSPVSCILFNGIIPYQILWVYFSGKNFHPLYMMLHHK